MDESLRAGNGLHVIAHESEPTAKIYMFIDGKYTHWVEFDLDQMHNLISAMNEHIAKMIKNSTPSKEVITLIEPQIDR
jgi:hypothetical protein